MTAVRAFAPAKINLTLHVTGRRADGFHLLDSIVVFAHIGDWVSVEPAAGLRLRVVGPMAQGVPTGADNLVLRAARLAGVCGADITLEKHLPMASGIGGGSSDAAATLRALCDSHGVKLPDDVLCLGADVPVCLGAKSTRMSGIGDNLIGLNGFPPLMAILVNPGTQVSTRDVFRARSPVDGAAMPGIAAFNTARDCVDWLREQRNDLQAAAIGIAPEIATVLAALDQSGAALARMSGSGATCFGLFDTAAATQQAADDLRRAHPEWWVQATVLAA